MVRTEKSNLDCEIVGESITEHVIHIVKMRHVISTSATAWSQHCVAQGIRLTTFMRNKDTKVSRGARKRKSLGPLSGATLTLSDRQRHRRTASKAVWRIYEQRTTPDTISYQATSSPIRCIEEVCRLPLKLFLSNVTSARKDPVY